MCAYKLKLNKTILYICTTYSLTWIVLHQETKYNNYKHGTPHHSQLVLYTYMHIYLISRNFYMYLCVCTEYEQHTDRV